MQRLVRWLANFAIDHPWISWLAILLVSTPPVLSHYGWIKPIKKGPRIRWRTPEDSQKLREIYGGNLQFAGLPTTLAMESDDFFTVKRLAALKDLAAAMESEPDIELAVWIGKLLGPVAGYPQQAPQTTEQARQIQQACTTHPLIAGQLLSDAQTTMLMPLITDAGGADRFDELTEKARSILEPVGIQVWVTGLWALRSAHNRAFDQDHLRIQITAYILVVGLAWLTFRSISAMLISISGTFLGLFWAVSYLHLMGEPSNELTEIILPVLVVMIGFTDGVHLVVHIRQGCASGLTRKEAARSAIIHVGLACALTSVTTCIGFASLMMANSGIIRWFGWSCSIAVVFVFVAVVTVIPMISASFLGFGIGAGVKRDLVESQMTHFVRLSDLMIQRAGRVAFVGLVLTTVLTILALRLTPDDRLGDRIPNNSDAYRGLALCDREMGGIRFLRCVISWSEENSFTERWEVVGEVERVFEAARDVKSPLSIRHVAHVLPVSPTVGGELTLSLLPAQIRRQFWDDQEKQTLVVAHVQDRGLQHYAPILDELENELRQLMQKHPGIQLTLQGGWIVEAQIVRRVSGQLMQSLSVAALLIFLVMTVAYRSLRMGLLAVMPNVFPLVFTGAVRGMMSTSLDIASACSFTICLGIAVDDTIHFLTRYSHERSVGKSVNDALRAAVRGVGTALVMTTIIMVAGFGTVMTSSLPTHSNFAAMGCATLIAALLGDLLILPALLSWADRRRERT